MKILLAYISGAPSRDDLYLNLLPTGLCYLQATLREAGYDAILANFSAWPKQRIRRTLQQVKPDVVGISQWTHNRHESLALAALVRRVLPQALIIMGGGHASFRWREILEGTPAVDLVVIGEGETAMLEIARRRTAGLALDDVPGTAARSGGRICLNPPSPPLEDLDRLPFQSRHLEHSLGLDQTLQPEFIMTARGCPSACRFCSSPAFWGRRVRFRSPASIVDEILYVRDRFGLIYFSLRDDTFTADRKRTMEFCRLLVERKAYILWNCQSRVTALDEELLHWMKRAGCECIQLGIESGSPRMLELLGKKITLPQMERAAAMIHRQGISLSVYLITDMPGESEEDLGQTMALIRKLRPDHGYVSPLAYYPGTELFETAVAAGQAAPALFETEGGSALLAKHGGKSRVGRLVKALAQAAPTLPAGQPDSAEYCFTDNVIRGEHLRQQGDAPSAQRLFAEITVREPENPWGWYLLGELHEELGETSRAARCYRRVIELVPQHPPSLAGLKRTGG